jgi:hypothetical protein
MTNSKPNRKLVKMSQDTKFVGINREDESKFRPGYIIEFIPEGRNVNVPVNDGFRGMEADEPYFVARSCYSSRSVVFSVSQLNNAMKQYGFEFELKSIPSILVEDDFNSMYEKSKLTGLCGFKPLLGGGKICELCEFNNSNGCVKKYAILERFNDGIEYCYEMIDYYSVE